MPWPLQLMHQRRAWRILRGFWPWSSRGGAVRRSCRQEPMGIQVCDQLGRVNCVIPTPNGRVANLCFGG